MSDQFIGEVRMFAGNFAPQGWAFCDGSLQSIAENTALFSLVGTTYGGDGQTTFALPDLRGRLPLHQGAAFVMGQNGGVESVTLTTQQMPNHAHPVVVSQAAGSQPAVNANLLAASETVSLYNSNASNKSLAAGAVADAGNSQPHNNLQPYLCVSFIIALFGIYPSQN
jgi:microcystin-dependent protein